MPSLRRLVLGVVVAVVVLGAAAGGTLLVLTLTAGRGTALDRMVPSDAAGYATVNLDPPADQKLDLVNLSRKFPDADSQSKIDNSLNQVARQLGLSYTKDLKPWLGAQVAVVATGGSKPEGALLIDSRSDGAAQQALTKFRTGPVGRKASWHTAGHRGVTLEVGSANGDTAVLAYVDHTVLIASSTGLADEIIDTDQGKRARLDGTAEYRTITGRLPASRLLTVYISGDGLRSVAGSRSRVPGTSGAGFDFPGLPSPEGLAGYKGFGAAIAARPDGLLADVEVDIDTSRLPAEQRALYERQGRTNEALTWMPGGSTAVAGTTKLDALAKVASAALGSSSPATSQELQSLTGDAAVEVEGTPSGSNLAIGAAVGSTDPAALNTLITQLGDQGHLGVASTVQGQYLLVASSPEELVRLQSAHAGSPALAGDATFKRAQDSALANPDTLFYVDVQSAFRLAGRLGLGGQSTFQDTRSHWSAVNAVMVTSNMTSTRVRLLVS